MVEQERVAMPMGLGVSETESSHSLPDEESCNPSWRFYATPLKVREERASQLQANWGYVPTVLYLLG